MMLFQLVFGLILAFCSAFAFAQAIDINTASAEQLEKGLKGIGPAKAAAIVKYREANGPFKSVDDLTKVPGIKDKALDKLLMDNKDQLTVGATAAVPAVPAAAVPAVPAAAVPAVPAAAVPAAPAAAVPAVPAAAVPAVPAAPKAPAMPAAPAVPAVPAVPAAPAK